MTMPRETVEAAMGRLAAQAAQSEITVRRLTAVDVILDHHGVRAGVTFDEAGRSYTLSGVSEAIDLVHGPGGPAYGMGHRVPGTATFQPGVLLAGKSWSSSIAANREHATGRWELRPTDPLSSFAYRQLTMHGWHRTMSTRAKLQLLTIPAILAVVALLFISVAWFVVAPWAGFAVVLALGVFALGLALQGPRRPDQALRKQIDSLLFWVSLAGPAGGAYLIGRAVDQGNGALGVLGGVLIVAAAGLQFARR